MVHGQVVRRCAGSAMSVAGVAVEPWTEDPRYRALDGAYGGREAAALCRRLNTDPHLIVSSA